MHFYDGYHFWGMHFVWWIIWIAVLIWIFATPWPVPGARKKVDSPLEVLQKRYAAGEISTEEYREQKAVLEEGEVE